MITRQDILTVIEPVEGEHMHRASKIYDIVMLLAITMSITTLLFRKQTPILIAFDMASCAIFILDYLFRWVTVDLRHSNKSKIWFILYPITPMAILDLLTIVPTLKLFNPSLKLFRLSRILKLLRVAKFFRYFTPLHILIGVLKREKMVLLTVLSFAIFYIFITAVVMFNGETALNPDTGAPVFENFFDSLYWATCTLTTVGYGDIYPVSNLGRVISMISALVGVAIIALPSGVITAGYLEELKKRQNQSLNDN